MADVRKPIPREKLQGIQEKLKIQRGLSGARAVGAARLGRPSGGQPFDSRQYTLLANVADCSLSCQGMIYNSMRFSS